MYERNKTEGASCACVEERERKTWKGKRRNALLWMRNDPARLIDGDVVVTK